MLILVALCLPNSYAAILVATVVAAPIVGIDTATRNPVAPLVIVAVGVAVKSAVVTEPIAITGIETAVVAAIAAAVISAATIVASAAALVKAPPASREMLSTRESAVSARKASAA